MGLFGTSKKVFGIEKSIDNIHAGGHIRETFGKHSGGVRDDKKRIRDDSGGVRDDRNAFGVIREAFGTIEMHSG